VIKREGFIFANYQLIITWYDANTNRFTRKLLLL